MSNQVYRDPAHKYFAQPGVSSLQCPATALMHTNSVTPIQWQKFITLPEASGADVSLVPVSHIIQFEREGIYSIAAVINVLWTAGGNSNVDLDCFFEVVKSSSDGATDGLVLSASKIRDPAAGSPTDNKTYTLSYTGYFAKYEGILVRYTQYNAIDKWSINTGVSNAAGTNCVITKIY